MCQSRHLVIFIFTIVLNYQINLLLKFLLVRNDDFGVVFGMPDQILDAFVSLSFINPDSLLSPHHVTVLVIGFEQLGEF